MGIPSSRARRIKPWLARFQAGPKNIDKDKIKFCQEKKVLERASLPRFSAATRLQYPVHRLGAEPTSQLSRQSIPKRVFSSEADQKEKLSEEMRNIQSSVGRARGSAIETMDSGGTICSGCVRQVRGLYSSARILA